MQRRLIWKNPDGSVPRRVRWEGQDRETGEWIDLGEGETVTLTGQYEHVRSVITYGEPADAPLCRGKYDWDSVTLNREGKVS